MCGELDLAVMAEMSECSFKSLPAGKVEVMNEPLLNGPTGLHCCVDLAPHGPG